MLFSGKFIRKKRPGDIIEAVRCIPDCERPIIVFVGSGELEDELRSHALRCKVRCVFLGFKNQSQLPACYAAADTLILPSDGGETWGLVVNEAFACGVPAIVSDSCGCSPDLIEPGVTGFTFPMGDIATLSGVIQKMRVLKASRHDWEKALENRLESFSVKSCVKGTLEAVNALVVREK